MEQWKEFLNKHIKLVYEDGANHYSTKVGIVKEINDTHIILNILGHAEAILLAKVLRIEERRVGV